MVLVIYMTSDERDAVEIAAKAYTMSMSGWARWVLNTVVRQKKDLLLKIQNDEELFDPALSKT